MDSGANPRPTTTTTMIPTGANNTNAIQLLKQKMMAGTKWARDNRDEINRATPVNGVELLAFFVCLGAPPKPGAFSQQFDVFLGNVRTDDTKPIWSSTNTKAINLPVEKTNPKSATSNSSGSATPVPPVVGLAGAPISAPPQQISFNAVKNLSIEEAAAMGLPGITATRGIAESEDPLSSSASKPMPPFHELVSMNTYRMSTSSQAIKSIPSGGMVLLKGVEVKAKEPGDGYLDWVMFLNVSSIVSIDGIDLSIIDSLPGGNDVFTTTKLNPLKEEDWVTVDATGTKKYRSRYDYSGYVVLDVKNDGQWVSSSSSSQSGERGESGFKILQDDTYDENNWLWKDSKTKEHHIKATLQWGVVQWDKDKYEMTEALTNGNYQHVLVSGILYEESLHSFGIQDQGIWRDMGYTIFKNLKYKFVGCVDVENTLSRLSDSVGIKESQGVYHFGLKLAGRCLIADIADYYKEYGIPVTQDWVRSNMVPVIQDAFEPDFVPPEALCISDMLNRGTASKVMGSISTGNENPVHFRVFLIFDLSENHVDAISKMTPQQGDEFMRVITEPGFDYQTQGVLPQNQWDVYKNAGWIPKNTKYYVFSVCKRKTATGEFVNNKFHQFLHGSIPPTVDKRNIKDETTLAIQDSSESTPLEGPEKRKREEEDEEVEVEDEEVEEAEDEDEDEDEAEIPAPTEKKHHRHRDKTSKKTKHTDKNE